MQTSQSILALTIAAALLTAASARAQVIASENFSGANYTTGVQMLGQGVAGANGWTGIWADKNNVDTLQSGSMSYSDGSGNTYASSGNSLYSPGNAINSNSSEPERTLSGTFGSLALANTAAPDTLWMSYLWQGGNTSANGSFFRQASMMFLKGATTSTTSTSPGGTEYLDVGMPNISSANVATVNPNFSLWPNSGNGGQTLTSLAPLQSTVAANNGATDFILIQLTGTAGAWGTVGGSETMNIWINPTLTGTTPVGTPNLSYSLQDLSVINAIRIQGGGFNATYGTLPGSETVGNILFGDTALDVEPLLAPVPEPGVLSLAMLGGSLTFAFLKRRNQSTK